MPKVVVSYPAGILIASIAAAYFSLNVLLNIAPPVITKASTKEKLVALTIDDGPTSEYTPQILDILENYGVQATFFVVGEQIAKNPDILVQEVQAGHELANHTFSHRNLDTLKHWEIKEEIQRTNGIIFKQTGKNVYWFRPPRGRYDWKVIQEAAQQGLKTVLWISCVETSSTSDPDKMAARVIKQVKPGGIILLHDGYRNRDATIKALPLIIEDLQKEGYQFVTLSQLLKNEE